MDILLGLLLLAAVLAVLAYPLYQARSGAVASAGGALNDLLAQRDGLYATLRDLDLDYELGKLDLGDYSARREKYIARASGVLQQLDLVRGTNGEESSLSDEIEREVAALRRPPAGRDDRSTLACPNCGRVYNEGDRFCGRCGHALP
jgi:zinc ribbon protein